MLHFRKFLELPDGGACIGIHPAAAGWPANSPLRSNRRSRGRHHPAFLLRPHPGQRKCAGGGTRADWGFARSLRPSGPCEGDVGRPRLPCRRAQLSWMQRLPGRYPAALPCTFGCRQRSFPSSLPPALGLGWAVRAATVLNDLLTSCCARWQAGSSDDVRNVIFWICHAFPECKIYGLGECAH